MGIGLDKSRIFRIFMTKTLPPPFTRGVAMNKKPEEEVSPHKGNTCPLRKLRSRGWFVFFIKKVMRTQEVLLYSTQYMRYKQ